MRMNAMPESVHSRILENIHDIIRYVIPYPDSDVEKASFERGSTGYRKE